MTTAVSATVGLPQPTGISTADRRRCWMGRRPTTPSSPTERPETLDVAADRAAETSDHRPGRSWAARADPAQK
jgi:hypothetical protein